MVTPHMSHPQLNVTYVSSSVTITIVTLWWAWQDHVIDMQPNYQKLRSHKSSVKIIIKARFPGVSVYTVENHITGIV